ncbi:hypothetical protein HK096_004101, partial [Nowakowskiella sp. JEL0078]
MKKSLAKKAELSQKTLSHFWSQPATPAVSQSLSSPAQLAQQLLPSCVSAVDHAIFKSVLPEQAILSRNSAKNKKVVSGSDSDSESKIRASKKKPSARDTKNDVATDLPADSTSTELHKPIESQQLLPLELTQSQPPTAITTQIPTRKKKQIITSDSDSDSIPPSTRSTSTKRRKSATNVHNTTTASDTNPADQSAICNPIFKSALTEYADMLSSKTQVPKISGAGTDASSDETDVDTEPRVDGSSDLSNKIARMKEAGLKGVGTKIAKMQDEPRLERKRKGQSRSPSMDPSDDKVEGKKELSEIVVASSSKKKKKSEVENISLSTNVSKKVNWIQGDS